MVWHFQPRSLGLLSTARYVQCMSLLIVLNVTTGLSPVLIPVFQRKYFQGDHRSNMVFIFFFFLLLFFFLHHLSVRFWILIFFCSVDVASGTMGTDF